MCMDGYRIESQSSKFSLFATHSYYYVHYYYNNYYFKSLFFNNSLPMLNLSDITLKFHAVAMRAIVDLQTYKQTSTQNV
jgi:hypothetical protein